MPNWIKGTLKLKGQSENLKRFFKEGLEPSSWLGEEKPLCDYVNCYFNDDSCEVNFNNEPHVCDTRRAFITGDYVYWNEPYATVAIEIEQAWCFDAESWQKIAKKYNLDIRLFGVECGMEFCQKIEIIEGEMTRNDEIKYDEWVWDCPMPLMGG